MLLKLSVSLTMAVCTCFVPRNVHYSWNIYYISVHRTHVQYWITKLNFKDRIVELTYAKVLLFDHLRRQMIYLSTQTINTATEYRTRMKLDSRKISLKCTCTEQLSKANNVYKIFVSVIIFLSSLFLGFTFLKKKRLQNVRHNLTSSCELKTKKLS
jgi:hypothetical protein